MISYTKSTKYALLSLGIEKFNRLHSQVSKFIYLIHHKNENYLKQEPASFTSSTTSTDHFFLPFACWVTTRRRCGSGCGTDKKVLRKTTEHNLFPSKTIWYFYHCIQVSSTLSCWFIRKFTHSLQLLTRRWHGKPHKNIMFILTKKKLQLILTFYPSKLTCLLMKKLSTKEKRYVSHIWIWISQNTKNAFHISSSAKNSCSNSPAVFRANLLPFVLEISWSTCLIKHMTSKF